MTAKHHSSYHLHIGRAVFGALAIVAIAVLHLPTHALIAQKPSSSNVLAYATNINVTDLANGTNTARIDNGLPGLSLSPKLNMSAQLKANEMIEQNYWSHVSPSGTQPWYWFTQAGYDYVNAGENLAYGFSTSEATIAGWMNSAGHRANILGSYQDVGFGIANGENYQGAQNTVVVAHYGTPRNTPPPPVAAVTPPQTPVTPAPTPQAEPTPVDTTPLAAPPADPTSTQAQEQKTAPVAQAEQTPVSTPSQNSSVPVWQQLLSGTAPLITLVSVSILLVVGVGYVATHVRLVKRAAVLGEQYILHHPVIDASVAIGASIIVLITTIGRVG